MGTRAPRPDPAVQASGWADEQVWTDGDAWFRALLAAIAAARTSVWLETYILAPDALGARVLAALDAAAQRGCEIRLLVDGVGAATWLRHTPDPGIPVRVWNPLPWAAARRAGLYRRWRWLAALNRRDHRKVCLVDGVQAWVGSFNVDGCHLRELAGAASWRDSGACVRGPGLSDLRAAFTRAWRKAWPTADGRVSLRLRLPALLQPAEPAPAPSPDVRLNQPWAARRAAYADLLRRIRSARIRIWITNAYVVPRGSLLRALSAARTRGVDVRLLAPARSDVLFMPWVAAIFADALLARGVRVFAYLPRMLHAKTMLIDERALVGSHNLNSRSFLHDLEAEVVLAAPASIAALAAAFDADCAEARVTDRRGQPCTALVPAPDRSRPAAGEALPMRISTWNLHTGHRGRGAAQAAAIAGSDLALLQEVVEGPAHADVLAGGWPHAAFARARGRFGGGAQGNLLLSRQPIATWTGHDLSNHPLERRVGLHAVIDGVHVVTVHLDLSGLGRRLQLNRLLQLLPADGPLILAGDCNDWSLELDRMLAARGLSDAHRSRHGRLARTWPARLPLLALDRIYVRGLHVHDAGRLSADGASDHHGVWAEVIAPGS